jgi:PAS domain S-box-containing protein
LLSIAVWPGPPGLGILESRRENVRFAGPRWIKQGGFLEKIRILIVEDEALIAANLEEILEGAGYKVSESCASGREALESVKRGRPDLVLMDIKLEGERDGIETAMEIRRRYRIPVVFLTAFAFGSLLERARKAEPYGYLIKPVKEKDLLVTLEMALSKARMEREIQKRDNQIRRIARNLPGLVFQFRQSPEGASSFPYLSEKFEHYHGVSPEAATENPDVVFHMIHPDDSPAVYEAIRRSVETMENYLCEYRILRPDGRTVWLRAESTPRRLEDGGILWDGVIIDITAQKEAEAEVETLRGIIPICASCKKIRDGDGYWEQVEAYVQKRSPAQFSHSICPECTRRLYPELYGDEE